MTLKLLVNLATTIGSEGRIAEGSTLLSDIAPLLAKLGGAGWMAVSDVAPLLAKLGGAGWMAGGAAMALVDPTLPITDVDLYFQDAAVADVAKRFLVFDNPEAPFQVSEDPTKTNAFVTTLEPVDSTTRVPIQLVTLEFYQRPEDVIADFDFVTCQVATDGRTLVTAPKTVELIRRRELAVNKIRSVNALLRRLNRYGLKGFTLPSDQAAFLGEMIQAGDFESWCGGPADYC